MGPRRFYRLTSGPTSNAVDYVELPEGAADIGDFRKALFDDVRGSLPSGLHISALKVSTEAHGRLALETPLAGYGESEDDPFFVEVPKVWFQLVDAVTHAAFMGTTAQSVPLAEGNIVESLQDAVFHKFSSAFPKKMIAAKLHVFEDFSAYEAKQPLEVFATLGDRGKDSSNPLCVVVPPPMQPDPYTQLGVGDIMIFVTRSMQVNPPGLVSFWQAMASNSTTIDYGNVVALQDGAYILGDPTLGSQVFIRDCYPELLNACMKLLRDEADRPRLVIFGNSGIGKTFFGLVLLLHLARARASVVYDCGESGQRFLFSPDLVVQGSDQDFLGVLDESTTYYVVDGAAPNCYPCKVVLLSPPRRSVWYDFTKFGCEFLYMPVWTRREFQKCHETMYADKVPIEKVEDCYRRWGGNARYVLHYVTSSSHQAQLPIALASVNLVSLVTACRRLNADDYHALHDLLHYRVTEHFQKECFGFASRYVQEEVYKRLYKQNKDKLLEFLAVVDDFGPDAVLRGLLRVTYVQ